jgi:hypothetical protein
MGDRLQSTAFSQFTREFLQGHDFDRRPAGLEVIHE